MYTPHTYPVALLMMLVSMLCWGSWANTQKIDKVWRFELFYWDYMWGILVFAVLFGLIMGRTNPAAPERLFHNLGSASTRSLVEAFVGGMIFDLGNLLLVAAISVAGMAVAFPLGGGLALVIGAVLNYIVSPTGNPLLLFGGIPIAGTAHQAGTVRFGSDPKTSALDVNCKAHALDNLYAVDASFFVSIAAVNPSLTIMANAPRVADHLQERLGSAVDHK